LDLSCGKIDADVAMLEVVPTAVAAVRRMFKESKEALDDSFSGCGVAVRLGKISHPFFCEMMLALDNG
jgi:hypothetical protein